MLRSTHTRLVAMLVVALAPATAHAGRSDFGWLFGTEVMPERGVEMQTWIYEQNGQPGQPSYTGLWWAPVVGITDQLEVSLPIEAAWIGGATPDFTLTDYGVDLRYRFVSSDPVEAGPLVPLARIAVKRDVAARDATILEGDFVLAYIAGRVHAELDAGVLAEVSSEQHLVELHPGAGVSVKVAGDLRLGAEAFAQLQVSDGTDEWVAIGPNMAWTHGRFWLSAAYGIGLYQIRTAPKIVWGVAF
jgi:hypothetical protein